MLLGVVLVTGSCLRVIFACQNFLLSLILVIDVLEIKLVLVVKCQVIFVETLSFYFGFQVSENNVIILFKSNSSIDSEQMEL